jgi:hypothetical protein
MIILLKGIIEQMTRPSLKLTNESMMTQHDTAIAVGQSS